MTQEASQPSGRATSSISIGLLTPEGKNLNAVEMYFIFDGGNFFKDFNGGRKSQSLKGTAGFKILFCNIKLYQ